MNFLSHYDIPRDVAEQNHSAAFTTFLQHWFVDTRALSRGEVNLSFLRDLTAEEADLARSLLRRNLVTRHVHIINGLALLRDTEAVPELRVLLRQEADPSRKLTVAGALWRIERNPEFIICLKDAMAGRDSNLKQAHFHQIGWLGDDRSFDLLIELLDDPDGYLRFLALTALNNLEFGQRFLIPADKLPRQPDEYRARRSNPDFRTQMRMRIQEHIADL